MKKGKFILPITAMALLLSVGMTACNNTTPSNGGESQQQSSTSMVEEKMVIKGNNKVILGQTTQLTAQAGDNVLEGVNWASDNEAVATVNANGLVQSVAVGKAKITATKAGYKTVSIQITVELEKITITATTKEVVVDQTITLTASVQGVTWSSTDEKVATVNQTGVVTGVAAGEATIKATKDGYDAGSVDITVVRPAATATLHMEDADHYAADGWWGSGSSGPGATPVYTRSSGNASDGTCIAYFGEGDKETLKFSSSAAVKAEITVMMAGSTAVSDLSTVETVKFNTTSIDMSKIAYTGESSSTFIEVSLGYVDLINGENALEFSFLASAPYMDDVKIYAKQATNIALIAAPAKETVAVEAAELSVEQNKTVKINVTNATGATFTSDKTDVATVDASGVVKGVSMGTANIIVAKQGMYSAKVKVTVNETMQTGEIRLEAELAEEVVAGTSSFMNLTDSTNGITRPHSGGGYISGYNVSGEETLTFKYTSDKAGKYALSVNGSPAYGATEDFDFKVSTSITFNTAAVTIGDNAKITAGDGGMSAPRVDADLGEVNLIIGENTLVVVFHGKAPSLDFFRLVPIA